MERMNMSARAYDRILKVARTIADLEGTADVLDHHITACCDAEMPVKPAHTSTTGTSHYMGQIILSFGNRILT